MDKIYLLIGNDTPLSVCLRKSEGEGDPVPYDLSTAKKMRLALVGHGMHVFAVDIAISGEDDNIVSGVIPGRSLLKGDYDLEVTFNLDGRDKRFAINDMFEAVDFLAEDADGETEGEGAGIFVTVTVQPELIEIAGPTGPQGKSAYQVWLDDGHTGTEDDFFEWLAAQTPNPDWNQNDSTKADFIKNRTHWEEESSTTINDAKLAWSGSTPEDLDFWFHGTNVHIPRTSTGWGLTWQGGELFIDDNGFGYELGVYNGEEWSINPFDPSYDQQPYPLNVDVVITSGTTVHKLPNKFLDMDSEPTTGSGKPVTSGGVKAAIADFITRAVNDLLNYYTKTETYTKAEVNQLVAGINNWEVVPVAQLPEASADTMHKIYLVPSSNPKTRNVKDEFITVEVSGAYSWEQIGTTAIDLTNYVTKQDLTEALADYVTSTAFTQALALKQDVIEDLPAIRQGASLGASAYQKPANGIPADDLEEGVIPDTSKLAEKDGYYPEMSVGSLKGTEVTQVEGITTIAKSTGIAKINEVMGKSLVWNQLKENGDFSDGLSNWYVYVGTATVDNGVATAVTNTESTAVFLYRSYNFVPGRKYLMMATVLKHGGNLVQLLPNNPSNYTKISGNNSLNTDDIWTRLDLIVTMNATSEQFRIFGCDGAVGNYFKVKNFIAFDLTITFGSGSEPSTVAEFESWLANNIVYRDYYAYNPGEIISNNTEALEITGLNQWDGEYTEVDQRYLSDTGTVLPSVDYRVSSYIDVLGNTGYYFKNVVQSVASAPAICWYDSEKNFISGVKGANNIYNKVITSPLNARYLRCSIYKPTADISSVSVSGSRNGEYEPYQKTELELNLATITGKLNGEGESVVIFPDGLGSVMDAYDRLIVDDDGWCRRAIRTVFSLNLGDLNWTYNKNNQEAFSNNGYASLFASGRNLCAKYTSPESARPASMPDKSIAINTSPLLISDNFSSREIIIKDSSYTVPADLKASLTGVKLYYEGYPQEYVLDTPIQMTFQAKHGGVIRQLPENGSEPSTAPMRMSVTYALPPEALISGSSLENLLNALKTANKISNYTMTYNPTSGKWEFTIL